MADELNAIVGRAKKDKDILAVIVFGSYARKEAYRDIDVCLVLFPADSKKQYEHDKIFMSKKKLDYLKHFTKTDIQIFQQLPLYIRSRVLKDGKIILCKDNDLLYDISFRTIKDFNYFEPKYQMYLKGVMDA